MQSIDMIETYAYRTSKDIASKNEKIKCNNIITMQKMINFDDVTKEGKKTIIQFGQKFLTIHKEH